MTLLRVLAVLCALAVVRQPAAQTDVPEDQLKAAFVFNFAKYVEWPDGAPAGSPLVICVIGGEGFGAALSQFDGRVLAGRTLQVLRHVAPADAVACHVAVLAEPGTRRLAGLLRQLPAQGVLTVGDGEDFIDEGGMIGLVRSGDRLQFDINQPALQRAGLRASSQLLKLARNLGGRAR
ncbi:YfiR family protein [Methyloversatilis universalis]|uniref:YfiR family protein n=1 Tax=Methyloversatilis universalis TaxID=378211 RepID=UPI000362BB84|nr:YfiR family protein [Methyloversatilis universalis]